MEDAKRRTRRKHSVELKARVLSECAQPGASVAAIAQAHGLNANLVHRWLRLADRAIMSAGPVTRVHPEDRAFIGVTLPAQTAPLTPADIRVELRRGATAVSIHWPVAAGSDCAAWLREWLR